ncbi:MAG: hypothetical protein GY729_01835 [Desulfobacteraceae bacterium]|nr:hypothetical protein [Desulfobacteraceae bacterium]
MKKLMVIVASLLLVASTAVAADWNFYGSARITTFVMDTDAIAGSTDTTNLTHALQGNSRIGARVKVNDAVGGRFEYGTGVNVRLLYGTWNFGAGQLLVGQTYSPLNLFYSNQVVGSDNDLLNYGGVYSGRNPMIRLTFGDFQLGFLQPSASTLNTAIAGAFTEVTFPKVEASYNINFGAVAFTVAGGYNTYELTSGNGIAEDVDAYELAIGAKVNFGPAYIAGDFWLGQNVGTYGMYNQPVDDATVTETATTMTINDNDAYGFLFVIGAKLNDMFSFEAGYGWSEAELDMAGGQEDDCQSYYVQSTITFAPGVFIVPEIGVMDQKQNAAGAEEADTVYYGLKWQINF